MESASRLERRRVRLFFAGLVVVSSTLDIVGTLVVTHQTRTRVLETLLPTSVTLGGRTGAVLSGLALLLLAGGIARGKRIAFRLTLVMLGATVAFELVKDLDFESAALFAWILFGLWWFRADFDADSDPRRLRWGLIVLLIGVSASVLYAVAGTAILQGQLRPEFGVERAFESLLLALSGSPTRYRALTERADWFLTSLPVVSYGLILIALTQLLRPVLAPRAAAADRERLQALLSMWGRNHISHLAVHGASSYHWLDGSGCVAFTLRGRTALALGDPVVPPVLLESAVRDFVAYCDKQDWIAAFYQVDEMAPYRNAGMTLVPIGAEAILETPGFALSGRKKADIRYAVHRSEKQGMRIVFGVAPTIAASYGAQLREVSGTWLQMHRSPELGYSLGTLSSLSDPDVTLGLAFSADDRLEAFVSWLPVPMRRAWTLDLMRRRPDAAYGIIEALIARSVEEARSRGILEVSLGVTPRVINQANVSGAWRAMYWGLDRFERRRGLHRFKAKFEPRWEERYLAVPSAAVLPEVMVALVRAHVPPLSAVAAWLRSLRSSGASAPRRARRELA
jgi:phosphatidylglycerol lysyltransferase